MPDRIVRIAARGDGVAESGRHVPFAVPGDLLDENGKLVPGPFHQEPPCSLFPRCGGCQLQHASDEAYAAYLVSRVETALGHHHLDAEICPPHLSPPYSRRRASLRALKAGSNTILGFNAEKSHQVVDMRECHILRPELFALVAPLRRLLGGLLPRKGAAEVQLSLADQGPDVTVRGVEPDGLEAIETITAFCKKYGLARLSIDQGYGAEAFYEPVPATVSLAGVPVAMPSGSFLQATADGEHALVTAVRKAVADADSAADLFAGLGTFALSLKRARYAAEASRDAVLALKRAAPALAVEHRDLYRRPLDEQELGRFAAVVLDPPRSGAQEQVRLLAHSQVRRIAYVSCNPATFARDAAVLVEGGYRLDWIRPVGQFRWSTHVELAACLTRA